MSMLYWVNFESWDSCLGEWCVRHRVLRHGLIWGWLARLFHQDEMWTPLTSVGRRVSDD